MFPVLMYDTLPLNSARLLNHFNLRDLVRNPYKYFVKVTVKASHIRSRYTRFILSVNSL